MRKNYKCFFSPLRIFHNKSCQIIISCSQNLPHRLVSSFPPPFSSKPFNNRAGRSGPPLMWCVVLIRFVKTNARPGLRGAQSSSTTCFFGAHVKSSSWRERSCFYLRKPIHILRALEVYLEQGCQVGRYVFHWKIIKRSGKLFLKFTGLNIIIE